MNHLIYIILFFVFCMISYLNATENEKDERITAINPDIGLLAQGATFKEVLFHLDYKKRPYFKTYFKGKSWLLSPQLEHSIRQKIEKKQMFSLEEFCVMHDLVFIITELRVLEEKKTSPSRYSLENYYKEKLETLIKEKNLIPDSSLVDVYVKKRRLQQEDDLIKNNIDSFILCSQYYGLSTSNDVFLRMKSKIDILKKIDNKVAFSPEEKDFASDIEYFLSRKNTTSRAAYNHLITHIFSCNALELPEKHFSIPLCVKNVIYEKCKKNQLLTDHEYLLLKKRSDAFNKFKFLKENFAEKQKSRMIQTIGTQYIKDLKIVDINVDSLYIESFKMNPFTDSEISQICKNINAFKIQSKKIKYACNGKKIQFDNKMVNSILNKLKTQAPFTTEEIFIINILKDTLSHQSSKERQKTEKEC